MAKSARNLLFGLSALLLPLALACGSGIGSGDFIIPPFWVYGQVVVADLNGDGRPDVAVVATYIDGTAHTDLVQVYLRNPDGGFKAPDSYPVGPSPWGLCAGDLDGTGHLDLLVAIPASVAPQLNTIGDSGGLSVLRHDPLTPGRFLPAVWIPTGGAAEAVAAADLDGDGRTEVVVADGVNVNSRVIELARAPGTAGFLPPATIPVGTGHGMVGVVVADLNGDGRPDLVLAGYDGVMMLYQQAGGGFAPAVQLGSGLQVMGVGVADLDGDGRLDIVAANSRDALSGNRSTSSVLVFLQTRPGVFTATSIPVVDSAEQVAVADLDGDGIPDIAVLSQGNISRVSALLQSPTQRGTFIVAQVCDGPELASFFALGDLDGDGRNDILVDSGPTVFFQTTTPGRFAPGVPLR